SDKTTGQQVRQGDVVGFVGDTGNARGGAPHLHLELHPRGGPATDPHAVLNGLAAATRAAGGCTSALAGPPGWPKRVTELPAVLAGDSPDPLAERGRPRTRDGRDRDLASMSVSASVEPTGRWDDGPLLLALAAGALVVVLPARRRSGAG
nr:M23 family metallopeptidase [Acidimicrobiia bacterium]